MTSAEVVEAHRRAGRSFEAASVASFVREEGDGDAVVCIHGVPASCFLYRKLLGELAARGLRGVAFDLPGLGLAGRPSPFDYSWTGLGRFCLAAVDALGLDRFHLVVHDIGGPIGFELAAAAPDRVRSLTVLNTMLEVDSFRRPWFMEPFAIRGLGEIALATLVKPAFRELMYRKTIGERRAVPAGEIDAYFDLLKREDGGRAFLKIMRGFERTEKKRRLYEGVVRDDRYPVRIVWGKDDPGLTLAVHGEQMRRATGLEIHTVPAKHFLQEDQAPAIAEHVAQLAATARGGSSRP
ncbi:MAG: alpha/beta hydrolase [Thermoleophilaceae bacterium]